MIDPIHCSEIEERLPLFVGGDLDPEGLEAVREHLANCATCSERHGVVSEAREAFVATLRTSSLPPTGSEEGSLWDGIRAVLEEEGRLGRAPYADLQETATTPVLPFYRRATLRSLPLVAAAAVLILFGWMKFGNSVPGGETVVDPFNDSSTLLADDSSFAPPAGTSTPVALPAAGSLRRLTPGETTLSEMAEEMPVALPARGAATPNSLAGYR